MEVGAEDGGCRAAGDADICASGGSRRPFCVSSDLLEEGRGGVSCWVLGRKRDVK